MSLYGKNERTRKLGAIREYAVEERAGVGSQAAEGEADKVLSDTADQSVVAALEGVPQLCVEFGEGCQTCVSFFDLVEPIRKNWSATNMGMAIAGDMIDLRRGREQKTKLENFRDNDDHLAAVVSWGRTRARSL